MDVGPFGPWTLRAPEGAEPEPWRTGGVLDQYTALYLVMAVEVPSTSERVGRRAFTPGEVDRMDLSTVAALIRVGVDEGGSGAVSELADLARRRAAGEKANWD